MEHIKIIHSDIHINNGRLFYCDGLIIKKTVEILSDERSKESQKRRCRFSLKDNIDVNKFINWFILNYPNSFEQIKNNPNHMNKFHLDNIF